MKKKMRYVRTKETDCWIIDSIKYKEITGEDCFIPKNEIVDEANTIEELCDEFIVFDNSGKPQVYSPFDLKVWTTDNKLYGAIWTDKGLIYIAKMNDLN